MVRFLDQTLPIPDTKAATLCELNRKLIQLNGPDDPALNDFVRAEGAVYPHILIPPEIQDLDKFDSKNELPNALKSTSSSRTLRGGGDEWLATVGEFVGQFLEALRQKDGSEEKSEKKEPDAIMNRAISIGAQAVSVAKQVLEVAIAWPLEMAGRSPKYYNAKLEALASAPVKDLAWHPYKQIFAIAHRQDTVHLYDIASESWFPRQSHGLVHEFQKDVTCLAWKPHSGNVLAVGCRNGVCVWRLVHDTLAPGSAPIMLKKGAGGGSVKLEWSPDGRYLLQICTCVCSVFAPVAYNRLDTDHFQKRSRTLRIYESDLFTSVELEAAPRFKSATWMPDSKTLIFAVEGSPRISALQMCEKAPSLKYLMHHQSERVNMYNATTEDGTEVRVGGAIKDFVLDPRGKRLAVTFEGSHPGSELGVLFEVKMTPLPEFEPIGFIRGPYWTPTQQASMKSKSKEGERTDYPRPHVVKFGQQFARGGLLSVVWENGKVGFLPCYYVFGGARKALIALTLGVPKNSNSQFGHLSRSFKTMKPTPAAISWLTTISILISSVTAQLNCGPSANGVKCGANDPCCSEFGICGRTPVHCSVFCQAEFSFDNSNTERASCYNSRPSRAKTCKSGYYTFDSNTWVINSDAFNGDVETADFIADPEGLNNGNIIFGQNGGVQLKLTPMPTGWTRDPKTNMLPAGLGARLSTTSYMLYGRVKARFTSGGAPGVVTAFITYSDEKDEIDFEITGENNNKIQSNFFYRGVVDYTKSESVLVPQDTSRAFYEMEFIWTADDITWLVDGRPFRQVTRASTCDPNNPSDCKFPSTPSRIQIALWDGSAGSEGTRNWAGGFVPWDQMPAGGFSATFQDLMVQCDGDPEPTGPPARKAGYGAPSLKEPGIDVAAPTVPGYDNAKMTRVQSVYSAVPLAPNLRAPGSSSAAPPALGFMATNTFQRIVGGVFVGLLGLVVLCKKEKGTERAELRGKASAATCGTASHALRLFES
ncbi:hypothetical protein HDV05_003261 [Chytridiales sp. JEL 0842]|nr:hypothetical protein HDV05_003261 [Chytridiales sp. JEL 0842]